MQERTDGCVVVDDIHIAHRCIAHQYVAQFGVYICADWGAFERILSTSQARNRAGAVAGRGKENIVTSTNQAACKAINDCFNPSVARRRDRHPRGSYKTNAHSSLLK
jgi:hypothetical protein